MPEATIGATRPIGHGKRNARRGLVLAWCQLVVSVLFHRSHIGITKDLHGSHIGFGLFLPPQRLFASRSALVLLSSAWSRSYSLEMGSARVAVAAKDVSPLASSFV